MSEQNNTNIDDIKTNERPRILCIDIKKDIVISLQSSGFNIYSGTLGSKIEVPNTTQKKTHKILPNHDFPPNLHEYDIVIIDLNNSDTIKYRSEDHLRDNHTGKSAFSLLSSYPETLFDSRPFGSWVLRQHLKKIDTRKQIILAFTTGNYKTEYESVQTTEKYDQRQQVKSHGIYSFVGSYPLLEPKYGKELIVCKIREDLKKLLEMLKSQTIYNQTFQHPTVWKDRKTCLSKSWVPLLKNSSDDIVSIYGVIGNSKVFYLPQFESKGIFLKDFLLNIAPSISPELFPSSATFRWKEDNNYWLPNYEKLLKEKKKIEVDFQKKLESKDSQILLNSQQFSFLHGIITETGNELVDEVIKFFKWLGFSSVINVDEIEKVTNILEEDIQIELNEGLLIIECKGIGGTSTDSACSQISKIKHRRCKERQAFDVFALYIVNHQRYLPPLNRQNPPFTENQTQDAIYDERGLLSTWQLFNLYFDISNGILTKDEAQKKIIGFGLVDFRPNDLLFIDEPKEIFKDGLVSIVNIDNIELTIGDELLVEKNGQFQKRTIKEIQLEGESVSNANTGEVGLLTDFPIRKKSNLWKKSTIISD